MVNDKVSTDFIKAQYQTGIDSYAAFTKEVGLWESERAVFEQYLNQSDHILDLGCGTGRTTFPLFKMGYTSIIGVDLTPEMIQKANELNAFFETNISFKEGDATQLPFLNHSFDAVIFSFNGLMSIPQYSNRSKALKEIYRVLKNNGTFIFTTHDRAAEEQFFTFWKEEQIRWEKSEQNPQLYEFGDLIVPSKNERSDIFIHIPSQEEVTLQLQENGFEMLETFYRSDRFMESEAVKVKSGECRFWITQKV